MKLAIDSNAKPIQVMKPVSTEKLALSTTAASAAAFSSDTSVVRIIADQGCYYSVDGTATTSSAYLPANYIEYIKVEAADTLSVILASGTGSMWISEMI